MCLENFTTYFSCGKYLPKYSVSLQGMRGIREKKRVEERALTKKKHASWVRTKKKLKVLFYSKKIRKKKATQHVLEKFY